MGHSVKGSSQVEADNIHSLFLTHYPCHLVIDHICQAGPASCQLMLTGPDNLVTLYVPYDATQGDLHYDLPQY